MKRRQIGFVSVTLPAALFSSSLLAAQDGRQGTADVIVKAKLLGQTQLEFEFTSHHNHGLSTYKCDLPWGAWYSATLVCVRPKLQGEILEKELAPIQDPDAERVEIPPGKTLRGQIDLALIYKDFLPERRKSDLIVFWSYQPKILDSTADFSRQFGWVFLPQLKQ